MTTQHSSPESANTDRELWRDGLSDNADSIHVTESGGIGINCNGYVIVMPLFEWHAAARGLAAHAQAQRDAEIDELREELESARAQVTIARQSNGFQLLDSVAQCVPFLCPRCGARGTTDGTASTVTSTDRKCPFDEENHTLTVNDICPVCGMGSGLNEWVNTNKCVGSPTLTRPERSPQETASE